MYSFLRPLLFTLEAERAHDLTLGLLRLADRAGLARRIGRDTPTLPTRLLGLEFPNPVGLAAGLDKNGTCIDALAALGFGFIEIGTTTPRPQAGNPRPRMFRLAGHEAIINRLGFNNDGVEALIRNAENARFDGILGINIGKNFDTPNERAIDDYGFCLERVYARASYVTVNLSSPNTEGLRELQHGDALRRLLGELRECQERLAAQHGRRVPMLVKIAPDLSEAELDAMALAFLDQRVDGVICTNTSVDHAAVADSAHADERGGLSGRPLFQRSTEVLAGLRTRAGDAILLVGAGGILDGNDAADKIRAGASLVQMYSGLVFRGPELVGECVREIARQHGDRDGA